MNRRRREKLAAVVAPIAVAAVRIAKLTGEDAVKLAEVAALEGCRDLCGRAAIRLAAAVAVAAIGAIDAPGLRA